ncbi:MAG: type II toxin-antitoxin system PemK/MazF family toxin [Candidatus Dormibacteria bacterium]
MPDGPPEPTSLPIATANAWRWLWAGWGCLGLAVAGYFAFGWDVRTRMSALAVAAVPASLCFFIGFRARFSQAGEWWGKPSVRRLKSPGYLLILVIGVGSLLVKLGLLWKRQAVVIVQDDRFDATDSVAVCAFTTDPAEAPLIRLRTDPDEMNDLREPSSLMVDKITTVPRSKLGEMVGRLGNQVQSPPARR